MEVNRAMKINTSLQVLLVFNGINHFNSLVVSVYCKEQSLSIFSENIVHVMYMHLLKVKCQQYNKKNEGLERPYLYS